MSNRLSALEILDDDVDINRAWETVKENIKISAKQNMGYYELKQQKPRFSEGCSKLSNQRKQVKL
jgi:hypothetical protein